MSIRKIFQESLLVSVLLLIFGYLDYKTGLQLRLFPLYFVPVGLISWRSGLLAGLVVSIASIATWEISNSYAGMRYESPIVDLWNIAIQWASLAAFAYLLSRMRSLLAHERATSRTDSLTGIANSRAFFEALTLEAERARRHQKPLTIAYLDLDNFKIVNDKHGHKTGDLVLQKIALALKEGCRATDVVARLGGDEFALLIPEAPIDTVHTILSRLQQLIREHMTKMGSPVTASIGATVFQTIPQDPDQMVKRADALMYLTKTSGKDAFRVEPA